MALLVRRPDLQESHARPTHPAFTASFSARGNLHPLHLHRARFALLVNKTWCQLLEELGMWNWLTPADCYKPPLQTKGDANGALATLKECSAYGLEKRLYAIHCQVPAAESDS